MRGMAPVLAMLVALALWTGTADAYASREAVGDLAAQADQGPSTLRCDLCVAASETLASTSLTSVHGNPLRYTDPDGRCAFDSTGRLNCLEQGSGADIFETTKIIDQGTNAAFANGQYAKGSFGVLMGTVGRFAQLPFYAGHAIFAMPYNAGLDAATPFVDAAMTGQWAKLDSNRAVQGFAQIALIGLGKFAPAPTAPTAAGRLAQAGGTGAWFGSTFDFTEQQKALGAGTQEEFSIGQNLGAAALGFGLGGIFQVGAGRDYAALRTEIDNFTPARPSGLMNRMNELMRERSQTGTWDLGALQQRLLQSEGESAGALGSWRPGLMSAVRRPSPTVPGGIEIEVSLTRDAGGIIGTYSPATADLYVEMVNVVPAFERQGYSRMLYRALLEASGDVRTVTGKMSIDNMASIRAGGIQAAPRTIVLTELGFTEHSFDEATRVAVARRPTGR